MERNNKGAAMISVLIAIMFIGLLATSLMYMSYNNYIAKSMRWSSSDNFYYDEFALDDLTSEMQQYCSKQGKTDTAIQNLENFCNVHVDNGDKVYDPAKLSAFLVIANSNSSNIKVVTKSSTVVGRTKPVYVRSGNSVTFKNLCIETTDVKRDFTSRITVDFTISITNTDQGSMKVNDFSLMSDKPIIWNTGGNMILGGNFFCMNMNDINGTSFSVSNGSTCTIFGDRTLIVGDMAISGNSNVCMSGQVVVTGNIKVESGSTLLCTSNLMVGGNITGGGVVKGNEIFDPDKCQEIKDSCSNLFGTGGDYAGGLASLILDDVRLIGSVTIEEVPAPELNEDGTEKKDADGNTIYSATEKTNKMTSYNMVYYDAAHATKDGVRKDSMGALATYVNADYKQTINATKGTQVYVRGESENENAVPNTLMFLVKQNQKLRQSSPNTTIIAPAGAAFDSADSTVGPQLDHMCDADYEECKNTMITKSLGGSLNGSVCNVTMGNTTKANFDNIISTSSATSDAVFYETSVDNGYVVVPYQSLSGTMKYAVAKVSKSGDSWTVNENYAPWGYFIRDDAEQLIMGAFDGVLGESNAMYSYVNYSNWVKE